MKQSDDLFLLIKSLDNNEKRHFTLYSSKGSKDDAGYIKLFNAINKQDIYDESIIKKKFAGSAFIKQFTVAKYKLYYQVLRSLESYNANHSKKNKIKSLIIHAGALFDKMLFQQSRKIILRAKKTAMNCEYFLLAAEAVAFEKKINSVEQMVGKTKETADILYAEEQKLLGRHLNVCRYDWLYYHMRVISKEGFSRSGEQVKEYDYIFRDDFLIKKENANSAYAQYRFNLTVGSYYFKIKDFRKAGELAEETIKLLEEKSFLMDDDIDYYISAIKNAIICKQSLRDYKDIPPLLEKLKSLKLKTVRASSKLFFVTISLELIFHYSRGEFEKCTALCKQLEDKINERGQYLSQPFITFHLIANVYFAMNKFKIARKWINKILHHEDIEQRNDIFSFSKIFNLIIHYELNDRDALELELKSTYRHLYKKQRLYKIESLVLSFIKKNTHITDYKKLIPEFKRVRDELIIISQDPYEETALAYFDYITWLQSKIKGITFAEATLRKKNNIG